MVRSVAPISALHEIGIHEVTQVGNSRLAVQRVSNQEDYDFILRDAGLRLAPQDEAAYFTSATGNASDASGRAKRRSSVSEGAAPPLVSLAASSAPCTV